MIVGHLCQRVWTDKWKLHKQSGKENMEGEGQGQHPPRAPPPDPLSILPLSILTQDIAEVAGLINVMPVSSFLLLFFSFFACNSPLWWYMHFIIIHQDKFSGRGVAILVGWIFFSLSTAPILLVHARHGELTHGYEKLSVQVLLSCKIAKPEFIVYMIEF